ncbi:malto-oligosyltrehalose synthase [Parvibaculum lavamentivorans DS-1]|uniref:Malto-oligosyltrehalose synthase n=1 Tax=Parvibaculum lavamentivorans (strain DS-1 / DSM 13023 / NCIMB 13966) TaxID=402881 RepID=A7HQI6_PARL1|nr:malto-oligosyltrehalose synthase [Parvibaculum lavamentivorans]ABS62169.1 malto-oligosyltrehalose synthase [Parvibaculum lavamentivorans DS-1]
MSPRATYRMQFHKDFTFADAEKLIPYLEDLGISHLYTSPITTARAGSMHGYDVVDPTRINPELGSEDDFRALSLALRKRGLGIVIDIVPNHMGFAGGANAWWQDVLAHGRNSRYARFFDIDWREKLLLPLLGEPFSAALEKGVIELREEDGDFFFTAYGKNRFPLRPEDASELADDAHAAFALYDPKSEAGRDRLRTLHDRQHYRLASWRIANDELNWRRFFTITGLAGIRIEDREVFEETHALYFRLYGEGLIDGVRIDHVDGLTDPIGYCRMLRERFEGIERPAGLAREPAYIVIEKILGADEKLGKDWAVDGTSGYDFMAEVAAVLHAPEGEGPLTALWSEMGGRHSDFEAEELRARQETLSWQFEGQFSRCVAAFATLARTTPEAEEITAGMLRRAIERLLWVFPVYRTYGTGTSAPAGDEEIRTLARKRVEPFIPPGEGQVVDMVLAWLAGTGPGDTDCAAEAVRRFQQLSVPIAAKAVEDTAFYRYGRLLSRNDVGFDAGQFASTVGEFHASAARRARDFPHAMLATATHDHKRGEDIRARLAVLSEIPEEWRTRVRAWREMNAPLSRNLASPDLYMLYQTLFGAWPVGLTASDAPGLAAFSARVTAWQVKALREAERRSAWEEPDESYEASCRELVEALLDPVRSRDFLTDLTDFVAWTEPAARANSLVQAALHYTVPGVPDLYQGAELPDLSLVDPDNRRPVDYAARRELIAGGSTGIQWADEKFALIASLLGYRLEHPALFAGGDYKPVVVSGLRSENVLAFRRRGGGKELVCAVALRCASALAGRKSIAAPAEFWGDTALDLPPPEARRASELFREGPVFLSIRDI